MKNNIIVNKSAEIESICTFTQHICNDDCVSFGNKTLASKVLDVMTGLMTFAVKQNGTANKQYTDIIERTGLFTNCTDVIINSTKHMNLNIPEDQNSIYALVEKIAEMSELLEIGIEQYNAKKIWAVMKYGTPPIHTRLTNAWDWYLACLTNHVSISECAIMHCLLSLSSDRDLATHALSEKNINILIGCGHRTNDIYSHLFHLLRLLVEFTEDVSQPQHPLAIVFNTTHAVTQLCIFADYQNVKPNALADLALCVGMMLKGIVSVRPSQNLAKLYTLLKEAVHKSDYAAKVCKGLSEPQNVIDRYA
jgi:hypothetical protein